MLYDHRTYRCRPGTLKQQLALYGEHGYPVQLRHLGAPLLYGVTEVGDVNSYIHIWIYKDAADRAAKRAKMQADPDWQAYLTKSAAAGNLISQENCLLQRAPFFKPEG